MWKKGKYFSVQAKREAKETGSGVEKLAVQSHHLYICCAEFVQGWVGTSNASVRSRICS